MDNVKLLALVDAIVDDAIKKIQIPSGERGPRGLRGRDGNSFNVEDHKEELSRFILENLPKEIQLTDEQKEELRGPSGLDGKDGRDGRDFNFEDHRELIEEIISKHVPKFEDFTEEQIDLLRGPKGEDGKDGKNFDVFENIEILKGAVNHTFEELKDELKLKFSDLTEEEKESLRGERGLRGPEGKSFDLEENLERIEKILKDHFDSKADSLKFKFEDLNDEQIGKLRGPRGQRGKPGRDFSLEESKSFIEDSIKVVFSESVQNLKLKFDDLTAEEKDSLKLKFDHLTFEEKQLLKGPRGQRGKQGIQGDQGERGEKGEKGDRGEKGDVGSIGPRGAIGPQGLNGKNGRDGKDGKDGLDAPVIEEVKVQKVKKDELQFNFELSDGSVLETNPVKLPPTNVYNHFYAGGGSSSSGGTGTANPTEFFDEGVSVGTAEKLNFVGPNVTTTKVGDTVTVTITDADTDTDTNTTDLQVFKDGVAVNTTDKIDFVGPEFIVTNVGGVARVEVNQAPVTGGISVSDESNLVQALATNINFVGKYVKVVPSTPIADWDNLTEVEPSLSEFNGGANPSVDVLIDIPDSSLLADVSCSPDVYIGSFVVINAAEIAENALANDYQTSNVIGLVESKSSVDKCDIRVSGISKAIFANLDPSLDYFLSDTVPGSLSSTIPTASGHVKLKLGQAFGSSKFLFAKGERVVRL